MFLNQFEVKQGVLYHVRELPTRLVSQLVLTPKVRAAVMKIVHNSSTQLVIQTCSEHVKKNSLISIGFRILYNSVGNTCSPVLHVNIEKRFYEEEPLW